MSLILAIIFVTLNILDVTSTKRALAAGNSREANPLLAWFMRHGNIWIVVKSALAAFCLWLLQDAPILLAALCVLYAIVVYRNFKLAR